MKKKPIPLIILLIFFVVYFAIFFYKPSKPIGEIRERMNYSLEDCKRVDFWVSEIRCENKVIKMNIFNSGKIDLDGDFLGIIYTPDLQAFIGGSTEKVLEVNESLPLSFNFGKSGIINKIEITFQPCPFSTKVIENLSIIC